MSVISLFLMPVFPLGRVAGVAAPGGLEIPHGQEQFSDSSAGFTARQDQPRSET